MENQIQLTLGLIPSPLDYRDGIATAALAPTLASIVLDPTFHTDLGALLNQNMEPACASNMAVELLTAYWYKKTGNYVAFSPRFLDTLAKRFDGQDRATGGTYMRLILQLLVQYGCATTVTLPNDTTLPVLEYRNDALLTPAVFAEAALYKTPGYFAIPTDKQSTRAAIQLYGAVGTGLEIGVEWYTAPIDPLRTPKVIIGAHATSLPGWSDPVMNWLRNHWGEWALNGEAHYDPIAWNSYTIEQWAIASIPSDTSDFLKTLPTPANFHYEWDTNLVQGMEVVGGIDFGGIYNNAGRYASDPNYTQEISALYTSLLASIGTIGALTLQAYISKVAPTSSVTGEMIVTAATAQNVDAAILATVLQHESNFGTLGAGAATHNPGNVGNVDSGATVNDGTWASGVNACAVQLARRQLPGGKDDVRYFQIALMILGFLAPISVAEFGTFGPMTATANAAYQKAKKIQPSASNVGPLTRAALNADFAVKMNLGV